MTFLCLDHFYLSMNKVDTAVCFFYSLSDNAMKTCSKASITILVDNNGKNGLAVEHGLSMWIETEGKTILFDSGQGGALEKNVTTLDVDLKRAEAFVLSHGHYDHTGGIPYILRRAPSVEVYGHPGIVRPRYTIRNGTATPIHMPREAMAAIDTLPTKRLHWLQKPFLLSESIGLTGFIPRKTDFEETGGPFYLDQGGNRPDLIEDDMALWIQTGEGLVVCVGCCHAGLVNTIKHVRRISGEERIRAVIGGFHLISADDRRIERTVEVLQSVTPQFIAPCHCTGDVAVSKLQNALGKCVSPGAAGMTYRF